MKLIGSIILGAALLIAGLLFSANARAQAGAACPVYFKTSNVCASVEFTKGPSDSEESQFLVKFYGYASANGEPVMVDPQNLKVDLWMNMGHHGHGSGPVKVVKQDQGIYFVSEAYFVMAGRWQIRLFVNGEKGEFDVDVKP
ncbi:FixH family protein [Bdellovibrio sp. HCB117]|uniref:FixH family protein n=1 Tax=Bdellovibrio sp. HCB117 TaxID=3394359 RepID=UPI0039B64EBA